MKSHLLRAIPTLTLLAILVAAWRVQARKASEVTSRRPERVVVIGHLAWSDAVATVVENLDHGVVVDVTRAPGGWKPYPSSKPIPVNEAIEYLRLEFSSPPQHPVRALSLRPDWDQVLADAAIEGKRTPEKPSEEQLRTLLKVLENGQPAPTSNARELVGHIAERELGRRVERFVSLASESTVHQVRVRLGSGRAFKTIDQLVQVRFPDGYVIIWPKAAAATVHPVRDVRVPSFALKRMPLKDALSTIARVAGASLSGLQFVPDAQVVVQSAHVDPEQLLQVIENLFDFKIQRHGETWTVDQADLRAFEGKGKRLTRQAHLYSLRLTEQAFNVLSPEMRRMIETKEVEVSMFPPEAQEAFCAGLRARLGANAMLDALLKQEPDLGSGIVKITRNGVAAPMLRHRSTGISLPDLQPFLRVAAKSDGAPYPPLPGGASARGRSEATPSPGTRKTE